MLACPQNPVPALPVPAKLAFTVFKLKVLSSQKKSKISNSKEIALNHPCKESHEAQEWGKGQLFMPVKGFELLNQRLHLGTGLTQNVLAMCRSKHRASCKGKDTSNECFNCTNERSDIFC